MASADYCLCDQCGSKAFYDGSLDYDGGHEDADGYPLPAGCGDWAVLCESCSAKFECVIVPKGGASKKAGPAVPQAPHAVSVKLGSESPARCAALAR